MPLSSFLALATNFSAQLLRPKTDGVANCVTEAPRIDIVLHKIYKISRYLSIEIGQTMSDKDTLTKKPDALQVYEDSRDIEVHKGFVSDLFLGETPFDSLSPFPEQSDEDKEKANEFIGRLREFLIKNVDPNAIDRDGEIPDNVIQGFKEMGIFGLKIPKEYGGYGFSQSNYRRIFEMLGSHCANTVALVAPPNSIGAAVPIIKFGTEAQKNKYLPRLASGKISAFGLTEKEAGSDPSRIETTATRVYDDSGEHIGYKIKGQKIWTTCAVKDNGIPLGDYVVVVAQVKDERKKINKRFALGMFLVDCSDSQGYSVPYRTRFSGLRAIYNGVLQFDDVFVPKDNLIGDEIKGFRLATKSLEVGRLTIVSSCVGGLKQSLQMTRWWCKERVQGGCQIGRHESVGSRLLRSASLSMITDALTQYCTGLVDGHKDVRLSAMAAKIIATDNLCESLDKHLMQIRAGYGYETYYSLKQRGEIAIGVERMVRDARVNRIFEGENDILTLASGREGLDVYKKQAEALTEGVTNIKEKISAGMWALNQLLSWLKPAKSESAKSSEEGVPVSHEDFIRHEAGKLKSDLLRVGMKYGIAGAKKKHSVIMILVVRAFYLFQMAVALAYAEARKDKPLARELADYFCLTVREEMTGGKYKTEYLINGSHHLIDDLSRRLMDGEAKWLEEGIISALEQEGVEI